MIKHMKPFDQKSHVVIKKMSVITQTGDNALEKLEKISEKISYQRSVYQLVWSVGWGVL